jgi:hypothetical protein
MVGEEKIVDILNSAELEEAFLMEINPKGQVSTLIYLLLTTQQSGGKSSRSSVKAPDYTP